ncbi:FG-GAP-like repeat-containing protein, partial [Pseudomonadota bacterium]
FSSNGSLLWEGSGDYGGDSAHETQTAADGAFQVIGIPAGAYTVEISNAGYVGVAYSVTAPGGGVVDLGNVKLAPDVPITTNQPPKITSTPPANATAGYMYEYQVEATDPEGGTLIYGIANNPGGIEIDTATGHITWIPTAEDGGQQSFTVVVSDGQGAIDTQPVPVTVQVYNYPSYVVTDVQTLNGMTTDELVPNNYVLGSYIGGGRGGTWRASSANGCGFGYYGAGGDRKSAADSLDFWSMGSGYGSDAIWDMGQHYSTVTVFPLIDHPPFPQEGIEYTIWGSNDPNASFPDDWALGTLVTIYGQGWADNKAVCGNIAANIDDYAGLYTFGAESFRYIRLKADNSISIFDTPEHTTWSTYIDDGGQPGWQSIESEIDAVGGMVCDIKPTADAGGDLVGLVNQEIQFDASGSQGNIRAYGWDLDGDSEIDLNGVSPIHKFTAGFDQDVTLLVVDDRGCVGADTVHVTIDLDLPRPDLTVVSVDTNNVSTNLQTLQVSGSVQVTIDNIGKAPAMNPALVTLFEDTNANEIYDAGIDNALGSLTMPSGLERDDQLTMDIAVNGTVTFRDSHIYAMVDSDLLIDEEHEDNNAKSTYAECYLEPTPNTELSLSQKWHWDGGVVLGPAVVGQLSDDNGDGYIDSSDTPDVVVSSGSSYNPSLYIISGDDGRLLRQVSGYAVAYYGSPALGDIDNDGIVEIVISNKRRTQILAFEHNGVLKWSATTGPYHSSTRDGIAIADLNHDGNPEIVHGRRVFSSNGSLLWEGSGDYGGETGYGMLPIAADVDLQGAMEIVAGRSLYDANGNIVWHRSDISHDGFNAVGNFDEDEFAEIVLVSNGKVYLLEHTGETIWGPIYLPGGGRGGAPTVGDFDADGKPEIGVAGAQNYVVLETNGEIKWTSRTQDYSSHRTGSSLFDFENDGRAEVLYADEVNFYIYDGETGEKRVAIPNGSVTTLEYPIVVDLDNDGSAEVVVPASRGLRGIRVFESGGAGWAPTRALWNQHSYHISNINADGSIPKFEEPSWLTHNTYRLNTFAEQDLQAMPDLTASQLKIINTGENQPVSLSVRIGNAGAGSLLGEVLIAFYEGDPSAEGSLLGKVAVSNLAPGQYQDVVLDNVTSLTGNDNIYAVADFDNRIIECNETNNSVMLPVIVQSNVGDIAVGTDASLYGPQSPVVLQGGITNTSALPGEFEAELRIEDMQGVVMASFTRHHVGPLAGGSATQIAENWGTGLTIAGTYRVHGFLYSLSGELIDEGVSEFEVSHSTEGVLALSLRTTTDKPVYHTTDSVLIDNLIQNLTSNALVNGAQLQLSVLDPNGTVVFQQAQPLSELLPHAQRALDATLALA